MQLVEHKYIIIPIETKHFQYNTAGRLTWST